MGGRPARRARHTVDERREEILDAVVKIIDRDGLANTRVGDVALELGISTSLIYYHFKTKEGLVAEAFAHAFERDLDDLDHALSGDDPVVKLRRIAKLFDTPGAPVGWQVWIDACALAQREPTIRRRMRQIDRRYSRALAAVLTEGVAKGLFTCLDPAAAVARIFALNDGLSTSVMVVGSVTRPQLRAWMSRQIAFEAGIDEATLA